MALLDVYNLRYTQTDLKNRVAAAIAKTSFTVLGEDANTVNHANRVTLANRCLLDTVNMTERFMWAVLQNASIQSTGQASTDNDILFVVQTELFGNAAFVNAMIA